MLADEDGVVQLPERAHRLVETFPPAIAFGLQPTALRLQPALVPAWPSTFSAHFPLVSMANRCARAVYSRGLASGGNRLQFAFPPVATRNGLAQPTKIGAPGL